MRTLAIETIVPLCVGVGLLGYMAFRVARGAAHVARHRFRDFVG